MGIFGELLKNVRKNKSSHQTVAFPVQELVDNRFDFEIKTQAELAKIRKEQKANSDFVDGEKVYDLNSIYWVFISKTIRDQNGRVSLVVSKAIPMEFNPFEKWVVDLLENRKFELEDVTKGRRISEVRKQSDDIILFSLVHGKKNYRVLDSGEYYSLNGEESVTSYNPGSPALIKLVSKTFGDATFSELLDSSPSGMSLKKEALVSKKDILKINEEIQSTYSKQRLNQEKKNERLSGKTF